MSEIQIDHEAAKVFAEFHQKWDMLPRQQNISRAYLDLHAQLAAERERVVALESALKEAIELSAACIIHSKSAEEVVATVNRLTAILNAQETHNG